MTAEPASPARDHGTTAQQLLAARIAAAMTERPATRIPARPDPHDPAPLSSAQTRIVVASQREPASPAYNVPTVLHLRGALDRAALLSALRDLAHRHEVLRSVLNWHDGGWATSIVPAEQVPITFADLTDQARPAEQLAHRIHAEVVRPFAVESECPARAVCLRVSPQQHVLVLIIHHYAVDASSTAILLRDLAQLYTSRLTGASAPPPPPLQYADFAVWERTQQEPERTAKQLQWWRDRLAGLTALLRLPLDRPRPPEIDSAGDAVALELPADLSARVRQVAASTRSSVTAVLLTAWYLLLGRVADTDDLAIGVITANRRHPDTESMPGCFADTIVVRGDLSGNPSGAALLSRVRDAMAEAVSHADVPLERIVEAVRPERMPGATPLFQALLNVYHVPESVTGFAGLTAELGDTFHPTARFDISIAMVDAGPGHALRGRLIYRTALFDRATAMSMRDWYLRLLTELVADVRRPAAELPIADVTGPILAGSDRKYPLDVLLPDRIHACAADFRTATAVRAPDGVLTYAELTTRANQLAHHLQAHGVRPDQPVAVLTGPSIALPIGMLAAMTAGGAYLPLDPETPPARIAALLAAVDCTTVLTRQELIPTFAPALGARQLIAIDEPVPGRPATRPDVTVAPHHLAYVIFTSGSTGMPKPVAVEHRNIAHYLQAVFERLGKSAVGRCSFAQVSTAAADLGLTCLFGALTRGGTLHLIDRDVAVDPAALAGYFAQHPVDVLKLVPSHLELLSRHGEIAPVLPQKLLILAGEACPWDLVDRVRSANPELAVHSHYGPTETTVAVLACDVDEVPAAERQGIVPLGRPLSNVVAHVVDRSGQALPRGVVGELVIGGPPVARGYLGDRAESDSPFISDPTSPGERCYRTGDLVRVHVDDTVSFHGRIDDQVKVRGYRVEPGEVTKALRRLPGVADAVVLPEAAPSEPSHRATRVRRLVAWLAPAPGARLDPAMVAEALRDQLPEYLIPAAFAVIPELPLNANGKVDRAALPAPEAAAVAERVPPKTPAEQHIARIWHDLLGCVVGRDDDFFALGGDSFRAVLAIRTIDRRLRTMDIFTHPTVKTLAARLDEVRAPSPPPGAVAGEPASMHLLHQLAGPAPSQAAITMVCVPYGGGSASAYRTLAQQLPDNLAVVAIELPGHDSRGPDEKLLSIDDVVRRCSSELSGMRPNGILVYGHCVGTALALALARHLERSRRDVAGVVLGASFPAAQLPGRVAGWLNRILPSDRWLPDRGYRDALRVMGALVDEVGSDSHPDGDTALLLRALRHDARAAEDWFSRELGADQGDRLRAPVLNVIGERDRGTELYQERYREWTAVAERVELATIPQAGHYFLSHQADQLAGLITGALERWRQGGAPLPHPVDDVVGRHGLRAFRIVAMGQLVSMVGTQLSSFALGVWVYQRTGRLMDFALITMLALVPAIFAAPLGGVITDRYDRRRVMLASDAASALAIGAVAILLWAGQLALWHILLAVTIGSLATAIQRPAYLASIAALVPKPYLVQANAFAQLGTGLGTMVAPLAGGVLIVLIGLPGVVLIDMATFVVGVATLLAVRFPRRLFRRRDETFRSAFAGGWRFIARRRPMILMTLYFVPVNYLGAVTLVLVTPLVLQLASPVALGAATAIGGLGAALGALAMIIWGGTARRAYGMVGFVIGVGVGTLLMGAWPSVGSIAAGLFLWWGSTSVLNAHWMAIIGVKVGLHLQGRVLAVNQMLATAMMPVGFVTAPYLAEQVIGPLLPGSAATRGIGSLLAISGLLLVLWGVLGLGYRPLRRLEDDLPDAIAGKEIPDDLDTIQAEIDALQDSTGATPAPARMR